jgi:hypothetical protein
LFTPENTGTLNSLNDSLPKKASENHNWNPPLLSDMTNPTNGYVSYFSSMTYSSMLAADIFFALCKLAKASICLRGTDFNALIWLIGDLLHHLFFALSSTLMELPTQSMSSVATPNSFFDLVIFSDPTGMTVPILTIMLLLGT